MKVLLFANGEANDGTMLQRALNCAGSAYILCADGGALNADKFGLAPQTIIGDLDSLDEGQVASFTAAGAEIILFPAEKNETDLELALLWCIEQGASSISILGALGGRFDQTLANIYLLALPALEGIPIEVIDGQQSIRLLRTGRHQIDGQARDTISLIPLGEPVRGITTVALKYPLSGETLKMGPARGISNVMLTDQAIVEIESGILVLIHTRGRA